MLCFIYLDTWILGVVSLQLRLLQGRVWDSTIFVNSLSPQMSELVEDAVASWCGDYSCAFLANQEWAPKIYRAQIWIFHFLHFRCLTNILATSCTNVAQIQLLHFLEGILLGFWLLDTEERTVFYVLGVFWFYFVPHCPINIWHHMLCYVPNIYNYITFTASLESSSQWFKCCTSMILYVNVRWIASIACMSFAFHGFQSWQQYSSIGEWQEISRVSAWESAPTI